jgi:hypothetical protein
MDKLDELTELEATDGGEVDTQPEAPPQTEPEQLLAGKYKSVDELAAAYQNAESLIGRKESEKRELQQQLEEIQQAQQAYAPQQPEEALGYSNDLLNVTPEQLNDMFERGDYANAMYIASAQMAAAQAAQIQQQLDDRLGPLQKIGNESQAERIYNTLKAEWGDEVVLRYTGDISERLKADPGYFNVPTRTAVDRLSDMIGARELRQTKAQATPRDSSGRFVQGVHVEGGSTPPPQQATPDEVDPVKAEIEAAKPRSDLFGPIPGKDAV